MAAVYGWKVCHGWYATVCVKDKLDSIPSFGLDIAIAMAQKLSGKEDPFKGKASVCYEIGTHEVPNEDSDTSLV